MDRLGVGWVELSRVNPRLIYASGSGHGLSGPDRDNLAMDLTIQAVSGLVSTTGFPDGPPVKAGPAVVDFRSGIHLYAAVTTALFERERTGQGRLVEVAMQEAAYATLTSHLEAYWQSGNVPPRTGNRSHARSPLGVYPTNDGFVAINVAVEEHWHHLLGPRGPAQRPAFQDQCRPRRAYRRDRRSRERVDPDSQQDRGVHDHQATPDPLRPCARRWRGHARPAHARARHARMDRARRDRPHRRPNVADAFSRRGQSGDDTKSQARPTQRRHLRRLARTVAGRNRRSQTKRRHLADEKPGWRPLRRENLAKPPDRAQHPLLWQPRPLAPHDEMIDTQKLAISCDLVLHRCLVANDEPVAREILKRTLRGAILQSPQCISVILVFQRSAAIPDTQSHVVRRRSIRR